MRLACRIAGALCLLSVACTDEPRGWTRVMAGEGDQDEHYFFVHADRDADVCITLVLSPPSATSAPADDVRVRGLDLVVAGAWGQPYAPSCTNDLVLEVPDTAVTGTVEFDEFINTVDYTDPCAVSFELSFVGHDERVYEMSAREFPIAALGCPRPNVYRAELTELDAAHGQHNGDDMLVVSAWDATREVCVWARFSNDAELPPSEVEIPDAWVYAGLRFGLTEREACVASNFIVPPTNPEFLSDSAPELGSSGTVVFGETNPEGRPCTLDLELDLRSRGRFDWTPDDVHMQADGVVVSGACD